MEKIITIINSVKRISLLFFLLGASALSAQITITHDDMPVPGTVMMREIDTSSFKNPGASGTDQTWDFSAAVAHYSDTINFLHPEEVPGNEMFPEANLAQVTTIYDEMGTINLHGFINSAEDGMYALGGNAYFISPGFSFLEFHSYDPAPNFLPLPFTFGSQSQTSTTGTAYTSVRFSDMLLDSTRVTSHITTNILTDGSGTLITPIGSYNTLRVREQSMHTDSTYSWNPTNGWEFVGTETYENIDYMWYAQEIGNVAILTTDNETVEFQYMKSIIIDVPKIDFQADMGIYPNPVGERLYMQSGEMIERSEIYSLSGQKLLTANNDKSIDVALLDPGIYICRIFASNEVSNFKFVKK